MAKEQRGAIRLTGTGLGMDITFYEVNGKSFWRKKSSLTKERVLTSPEFEKSRQASARFSAASTLAKLAYWQLSRAKRKHGLIGRLTALCVKLLKNGCSAETAVSQMILSAG